MILMSRSENSRHFGYILCSTVRALNTNSDVLLLTEALVRRRRSAFNTWMYLIFIIIIFLLTKWLTPRQFWEGLSPIAPLVPPPMV